MRTPIIPDTVQANNEGGQKDGGPLAPKRAVLSKGLNADTETQDARNLRHMGLIDANNLRIDAIDLTLGSAIDFVKATLATAKAPLDSKTPLDSESALTLRRMIGHLPAEIASIADSVAEIDREFGTNDHATLCSALSRMRQAMAMIESLCLSTAVPAGRA